MGTNLLVYGEFFVELEKSEHHIQGPGSCLGYTYILITFIIVGHIPSSYYWH